MAKRYVLVGGVVYGSDRDRHYVGPRRLAELYRLPLGECVLAADDEDARWKLLGVHLSEVVVLGPDPTGRYIPACSPASAPGSAAGRSTP